MDFILNVIKSSKSIWVFSDLLRPDENVRDVLVLAEERDVQKDLEGLRVRRQDHELRLAAVQRLGSLVDGKIAKFRSF